MMLDYNYPLTNKDLDLVSYGSKFKLCNDFLSSSSPTDSKYLTLFQDITSFSYIFFRLDGSRVTLFPYQDMILNDPYKYKIFRAARQIGKSLSLDIKSAYNLLRDHSFGHNECIISASLAQASYQMRRVKGLLNSMPHIKWREQVLSDNQSLLILDVLDNDGKSKYQNMLVVTPCTEGSLGYSFHSVNLDEIEYWKDIDVEHFMNNIIGPTILATDGSITTFSNPNGSESYIAKLENLRLPNGHKKWHTYVFNFFDCPLNTQDKFDIATAGLTRQQIESQYLAIRTLSDRYYFSSDEIQHSFDPVLDRSKSWIAKGKVTYWFLDVGAKHDQSVLVGGYIEDSNTSSDHRPLYSVNIFCIQPYPVGYPISRVVGSHDSSHDSDGWHYVKSVKDWLTEYRLSSDCYPLLGCDVTGNSGIMPLFASCGISIYERTFSGPKKWSMYQRLKYYLEKRLLHRVTSSEFDYQMSHIIVTPLRTSSYNRVGHENENDLDDVPDAVAGLISICDDPDTVQPGVSILDGITCSGSSAIVLVNDDSSGCLWSGFDPDLVPDPDLDKEINEVLN